MKRLRFRVWSLGGFWAQALGLRVLGSGFRVSGSGFRVQGFAIASKDRFLHPRQKRKAFRAWVAWLQRIDENSPWRFMVLIKQIRTVPITVLTTILGH